MGTEQRRVIVALQYIRGIAALLVVWDHALATLVAKVGRPLDLHWAWHLGELGVAVFFVISGAVMVMGHHHDFGQNGQVRIFVLKRIFRIIPLYWIATAVYVLKLKMEGTVDPVDVLQSLFLIPHAAEGRLYGRPIYELGWTLQYEMFFYGIFALALMMRRSRGLAFVMLVMMAGVLTGEYMPEQMKALTYLVQPIVLYFIAGICIGCAYQWRLARASHSGISPVTAMGLATGVLLLDMIGWHAVGGAQGYREAMTAAAAVMAVAVCAGTLPSWPDSRMLRACVWMGNITYALYLTHSFVLGPMGRAAAKYWPQMPSWFFVILAMMAALCLAHLVYEWLEKPIMARTKKYVAAAVKPQVPKASGPLM